MRKIIVIVLSLLVFGGTSGLLAQFPITRAPAVPLITCDPYFSVWSFNNHPADDYSKHWTGSNMSVCIMAKIDGKTYRVVGNVSNKLPKLKLQNTTINPTQTIYSFDDGGVSLTLKFTTPLLPESLESISRPVSYITWLVKSSDAKEHKVQLYLDESAEFCVNSTNQDVNWGRLNIEGLNVMKMGSAKQPILETKGDNVKIDWGYLYLVSPKEQNGKSSFANADVMRKSFIEKSDLPVTDDFNMPRPANDGWPAASLLFDLGSVGEKLKEVYTVTAYDDIYSIEFLQRKLPAYWKKDGKTISDLLSESVSDYKILMNKCEEFDKNLMAKLQKAGGEDYAAICALSYRHTLAAHKLAVDIDGSPLLFPKENFSGGFISTVDVIYPAAPFFMYFSNELLKASMRPVLEYAGTSKWKFPFAPHDLGSYPIASGQLYGGGEKTEEDQMPVEESGNMIILIYSACKKDNNIAFAKQYWKSIEKWADYLKEKGLDPENQLCTDDFTGHLAHNTNLSVKAIVALGCFSKLCEMNGMDAKAKEYYSTAKKYAAKWEEMAFDKDHYRLAFDKPDTWSMKYNLVWDKLLDLNIFAPIVFEREQKYYLTKLNKYGLPLDNRADFTKPEWMTWTATMSDSKTDFEKYMHSIVNYINETPDRVPFSDWYETKTGHKDGFQARSVVGGIFIKMLKNDTGN